jgi:hypothetical protein
MDVDTALVDLWRRHFQRDVGSRLALMLATFALQRMPQRSRENASKVILSGAIYEVALAESVLACTGGF